MDIMLSILSYAVFALLAAGLPRSGSTAAVALGVLLAAALTALAAFLLIRDSTPRKGVVLMTAAGVCTAVRLMGGSFTPAVVVYPLLFVWMKAPSISGPLYHAGLLIAVADLLGCMAPGWGNPVAALDLLPESLAAFLAPFVGMFGADFLSERRRRSSPPEEMVPEKVGPGAFPEDVARSMLPLLHRSTGANGAFLVVRDGDGRLRLVDGLVSAGAVAAYFSPAADDPFVEAAMAAEGVVALDITQDRRLPWYSDYPGTAAAVMVPLLSDGEAVAFYLCDFHGRPAPAEAGEILLDAAGAVAAARLDITGPSGGMLADICMELGSADTLKAAIHTLVAGLSRHLPGAAFTVAVLTGDRKKLQVYETLGIPGSARRGRLFSAEKGVAGWAVSHRETVFRREVDRRNAGIKPFLPEDEPGRRIGSCCAVPLFSERSVFGVLVAESPHESGITRKHTRQLEAAGAVFGLCSARMVMQERLGSLSHTDSLTGLPSYALFRDELQGLVGDVRKGLSAAVLVVDILGFGKLNREYGVRVCDLFLREAVRRIARVSGGASVMTRIAPGRFFVVLPGADRASAQAYAGRIMEAFSLEPFRAGERDVMISTAVGGAASRVDRMVTRLPDFALEALDSVRRHGPGPLVLSVDQFGKTQ